MQLSKTTALRGPYGASEQLLLMQVITVRATKITYRTHGLDHGVVAACLPWLAGGWRQIGYLDHCAHSASLLFEQTNLLTTAVKIASSFLT